MSHNLQSRSKTSEDEMNCIALPDAIIVQRARVPLQVIIRRVVFQLFITKDEPLHFGRNPLTLINHGLHLDDLVQRALHVERDSPVVLHGLHKDLHPAVLSLWGVVLKSCLSAMSDQFVFGYHQKS